MNNFTPFTGTIGGLMIGLSATTMMLFLGRITGISGIFGGLVVPREGEVAWRLVFVAGLLSGGLLLRIVHPQAFPTGLNQSFWLIATAGLLVGFGTRMGSGCTSGHGICGLARFSQRSLASVLMFIFTGAVAVYLMQHFKGGI